MIQCLSSVIIALVLAEMLLKITSMVQMAKGKEQRFRWRCFQLVCVSAAVHGLSNERLAWRWVEPSNLISFTQALK